jgi:hypothetical protein
MRPTPKASPPIVIRFTVLLVKYIKIKVVIMDIGMETKIMKVLRQLRKNRNITSMAKMAPSNIIFSVL